ncbi:MAG: tyrosinase family protein [Actinobacteria bacterium]|nr:tyrosinase family protein [Actinomycetota bacterium]
MASKPPLHSSTRPSGRTWGRRKARSRPDHSATSRSAWPPTPSTTGRSSCRRGPSTEAPGNTRPRQACPNEPSRRSRSRMARTTRKAGIVRLTVSGTRSKAGANAQTPPRQGPWMHNRVHVFIGGSMEPASSPNDPVFFLNHCNVDRQWEAWLTKHGRTYAPGPGEGPSGHRADDPLLSIVWPSMRPSEVLDPASAQLNWYRYDVLPQ